MLAWFACGGVLVGAIVCAFVYVLVCVCVWGVLACVVVFGFEFVCVHCV